MEAALVIDTCGSEGYVAVFPVGEVTPAARSEQRLGVRATQEELLPAIGAVLSESGLVLSELKAIAVVRGPGSFTGVRIGLAAAKGLCEAAGLPLVTLSRLQVLAAAAGIAPVWAWLQAGRGDVYAERFVMGAGGFAGVEAIASLLGVNEEREPAQVLTLEQAAAAAGGEPVAVCEEALRAARPSAVFVSAGDLAAALRAAAAEAVCSKRWADVALIDALYLRVPDAELALRARQALSQP
ncbi:tRNA (adenosine(37)-N6)-threonylcarbamoyltransferase complex dimerization subunit type 1 TsaB [Terriglobus aquaticus]|uniref:tRNA (Adenosine(37)-N6)-threonylcarbamoyltransferase complex dimerization subunit type 1 TsaB n=1 Tax=Terriglobus aquaticus TaxID=940139 RepID=A0ABW9KJP4_9BACT|nr:tRNA (adenosine(37)-N6)-threonylcarbamoyltransferase complex dimerization subunit type 1 TsaB [Terriglobus aquaticus]